MTKKKVVVKVSMNGRNQKLPLFPNFRRQDYRLKALQIATAVPGFQLLSLKRADQDVVEVTGEEVDAVDLIIKLRKCMGYVNLEMAVNEVKEEKKPEKEAQPKPAEPPVLPASVVWPYLTMYCVTEPQPACCTVM